MKTELIDPDRFSFQDMQFELGHFQNAPVSRSTLYYWIAELSIKRDKLGFYHREDIDVMKFWITVRDEIRTFDRFRALLLEEQ